MEEEWAVPLAPARRDEAKRVRLERMMPSLLKAPNAEEEENSGPDDRLSGDKYDIPQLQAYLQKIGFLDESLAVHEHLQTRDPMLIVLESPDKQILHGDGTESTVIDELIKSGHRAFHKSCGSRYMDFEMIQYAVQSVLASKDVQAKVGHM